MRSASPSAWILRARERAQMTVTPPEANTEYSRGSGASRGVSEPHGTPRGPFRGDSGTLGGRRRRGGRSGLSPLGGPRAAILAGALLGALLLLVAEFTTLFTVRVETSSVPIKTVTTGSHHSYALIPIAVLGAVLAIGACRHGSRPALLGDRPARDRGAADRAARRPPRRPRDRADGGQALPATSTRARSPAPGSIWRRSARPCSDHLWRWLAGDGSAAEPPRAQTRARGASAMSRALPGAGWVQSTLQNEAFAADPPA